MGVKPNPDRRITNRQGREYAKSESVRSTREQRLGPDKTAAEERFRA